MAAFLQDHRAGCIRVSPVAPHKTVRLVPVTHILNPHHRHNIADPARIQNLFSNFGIKTVYTAFYMRELGIIAKDPDEGEILYAYINFGDGASAMPAFDGSTYIVRNIQMSFIVSNAANVEANITLAAEVSYDDFMAHKMQMF